MGYIKINKDKCKGCMLCLSVCPKGLIKGSSKLNKMGIYYVEFVKNGGPVRRSTSTSKILPGEGGCTGCAMCALICPDVCIEVYK